MVLLEIVALSALPGLLLGGSLRALARLSFRFGWLFVAAVLLQSYVVYLAGVGVVSGLSLSAVLLILSYAALVLACGLNLRLPGMPLIAVGLFLNLLVMLANGGFMPVSPEALTAAGFLQPGTPVQPWSRPAKSKDVLVPAEQIRLAPLADVLVLSPPLPFRTPFTRMVFSVGDVVVALGAFVLLQAGLDSRLALLRTKPPRAP